MATGRHINYESSYTGDLFHKSMNKIKCIRGPVGSGKSVTCCMEIFRKSNYEQAVHDGMRWSQWLIGRNTFDDIKKTTVPTWLRWFPGTKMHWSPPFEGRLEVPCCQNDGTTTRIDLLFYPLDKADIIDSLMSLELSGAWINEATQTRIEVVDGIYGRLGRFGPAANVKGKNLGMLMDANSPDESNWWYEQEVVRKPDGVDFFVQPPGLLKKVDPKTGAVWYEPNDGRDPAFMPAENIENLEEGFEYYHKQTLLGDTEKIKRIVLNQFGSTMDGKPVYPEYDDAVHFTNRELTFEKGLPLLLGTDFGRTPAIVIGQMSTSGQFRVIDEIATDNMGIRQCTEEKLRPLLVAKYNFPLSRHINWADPAGADPGQINEVTCIQTMNSYGIKTCPAPVPQNSFHLRRDCVAELLRSRRDKEAAIIIGRNCPLLRKGFNGGYHYRRMRQKANDEIYADAPEKNEFSHLHDALQYMAYGAIKSGVDYSQPVDSPFGINARGFERGGTMSSGISLGPFGC